MFKVSKLFKLLFAAALPMYAFDENDPADVELVEKKIAEATDGLKAKNKELMGALKAAKNGAQIDPADHAALEQERDELVNKLGDANKLLKTTTKAAEDAAKALGDEKGFTERLLADNGLNEALLAAGVKNPAHLKGAAALLRSGVKIEVGADGARLAKIGDKSLADAVKEWSATDDGKAYVSAPQNGGGGGNGGTKAPPASNAKPNMGGTKEERIAAINQMRAEGGLTDN